MAKGPMAKHPSARARRNKTATSTTLVHVDREDIVLPTMPVRRREVKTDEGKQLLEVEWHGQAKLAWAEIWSSPMVAEYLDADLPLIHAYVGLVQDVWERMESGRSFTEAAAELRQYAAIFGIGPDARRRLQWTIEEAEAAMARGDKRRRDTEQPVPIDASAAWDAIDDSEDIVEAEVVE